jgi:hypothetical protein
VTAAPAPAGGVGDDCSAHRGIPRHAVHLCAVAVEMEGNLLEAAPRVVGPEVRRWRSIPS